MQLGYANYAETSIKKTFVSLADSLIYMQDMRLRASR